MKLVSFTVNNYRSITSANKIEISDITILVGKNNEGKSNLLRAINLSMIALRCYQDPLHSRRIRSLYEWSTDYPVSLQKSKKGNKKSVFTLEFELTPEEVLDFKTRYKHTLNGYLPIRIAFGQDNSPEFKVVKNGKGSVELNKKSRFICKYIAQNIEFNYIPAVRTEDDALREIRRQVMRKLSSLEENPKYKEAIELINSLQKPIMESLEEAIKKTLSDFIPNVSEVYINFNNQITLDRYRDVSIRINDGQNTDIQNKGDGIKSLVTLALLNNSRINPSGMSIVAIEEPEAHLHPEAINRLKESIYTLSKTNQVIISTHNPLFVNREYINKNIIVEDGIAKQARNIREIRNILGVKLSDNLYDAELILLVEGETDAISLLAILSNKSEKIKIALDEHRFVIMPIGGTGRLSQYLTMTQQLIGKAIVLLDSDNAGRTAVKEVQKDNLLDSKDYLLCTCDGMKNSEFEDLIDISSYRQSIIDRYGVDLQTGKMRNKTKVWSDKVKEVFNDEGKLWDDTIETEIKYMVSSCVRNNPYNCITGDKYKVISNLISVIEKNL
jgi:predicted ATP-dependent endonuclease of OLD family